MPLFGYLYGAKQHNEMKRLIRFCIGFMSTLSVVLTAGLCLFATPLMGAFVKDTGMIATGARCFAGRRSQRYFVGVVLLLTVLFQAIGKVIPAFVLSISRQGVVFVVALFACVKLFLTMAY